MIEIKCRIKVIAYASNKEIPEILDIGSHNYSIIPPEVLDPLRLINNQTYNFTFRENATIKTLMNKVKHEMHEICPDYNYWDFYLAWAIMDQDRYYLDDINQNFPYLLRKYFGYPETNNIELQLLISGDAQEVCRSEGLLYYVHSHERGRHHLPHVHVTTTDHNQNAVIQIYNGEKLEGNLRGKLLRKAKEQINNNKKYFYKCWNAYTDGIRVDINNHFKLIGY